MSEGWLKLYAAAVTGVFLLAAAVVAIMWPDANVERQTDVQFVNMAVEILAEEPTPEKRPLREWAIELINRHSKAQIDEKARAVLLDTAWSLKFADWAPYQAQVYWDAEKKLRALEENSAEGD